MECWVGERGGFVFGSLWLVLEGFPDWDCHVYLGALLGLDCSSPPSLATWFL